MKTQPTHLLFKLLLILAVIAVGCDSDESANVPAQDVAPSSDASGKMDTGTINPQPDLDRPSDRTIRDTSMPDISSIDASRDASSASDADQGNGALDSGGEGDADKDIGNASYKICLAECQTVQDCSGQNPAQKWECTGNRCRPFQCTSTVDCVDDLSVFVRRGCKSGECNPGFGCIVYQTETFCVPEMTSECRSGETERELDKEDGSGKLTVCVNEQRICEDNVCVNNNCESNDDCLFDLVCSDSGECICEIDAHCPAVIGLDICNNGKCACSGDDVCAQNNGLRNYFCAEP